MIANKAKETPEKTVAVTGKCCESGDIGKPMKIWFGMSGGSGKTE